MQAPDIDFEELRRDDAVRLEPELELEAVEVEGADWAELDAGSVRISQARLREVALTGSRLRGVRLLDVVADDVDAANGDWSGATIRRAVFESCRLTGLDLNEAVLDNVVFRGCKLDYANLRFAQLSQVTFDDCVLVDADAQGSSIASTRFRACRMVGTDFAKAELRDVDLRGSELRLAGGVAALRGATVSFTQLIELAEPLAAEAGIVVADDE